MAVSLILRKVIILSGMISKRELNKSLSDEIDGKIGQEEFDSHLVSYAIQPTITHCLILQTNYSKSKEWSHG